MWLALLLACVPPASPEQEDPTVRDHLGAIGGDRPVQATFPTDYDVAGAHPLLVLLHGFGSNATVTELFFDVAAEADRRGVVTLAPEGTVNPDGDRFWSATPECCDWYASGVDDAGYLSALLDEAVARYAVDPERIYLLGLSNGAFMAHRMACDHGDQVAGIASFNGSSTRSAIACSPDHPVHILQVHGTADTVVPYLGNASFPGAPEVVERWAAWNACEDEPVDGPQVAVTAAVAGDETEVLRHVGCDEGGGVELWTMHGAGHVPYPLADFDLLLFEAFLGP